MLFFDSASSRSSGVERVLPICALSIEIAISSMMIPPPTSSEPTEIPKKSMICWPSSVVTAITQNTETAAMRIVCRRSASVCWAVRLRKNGTAPSGLISASREMNDLSRSIASRRSRRGQWGRVRCGRKSEAALRRRNLPRRALVEFHRHPQRAAERLEHRLELMVRIDAAQIVDMQRDARVIDEAAEELDRQVDVERADPRA